MSDQPEIRLARASAIDASRLLSKARALRRRTLHALLRRMIGAAPRSALPAAAG